MENHPVHIKLYEQFGQIKNHFFSKSDKISTTRFNDWLDSKKKSIDDSNFSSGKRKCSARMTRVFCRRDGNGSPVIFKGVQHGWRKSLFAKQRSGDAFNDPRTRLDWGSMTRTISLLKVEGGRLRNVSPQLSSQLFASKTFSTPLLPRLI